MHLRKSSATAQGSMSGSHGFLKAVMDTIADQVAVIDGDGVIRFVNRSWIEFARNNSSEKRTDWTGVNYLEICEKAAFMGDEYGGNAVDGIRDVIDGRKPSYYLEYPSHSQETKRWFMMRVTSFQIGGDRYYVVSHHNITERKIAEEEMLRLSRLDGLTNIYNRRYFDEFLRNEWKRCARLMMPVTLAIADIDNFKMFNDTYGHHAGDECLKKIANVLTRFARRPSDLCARYGGEEFALVFGNTDAGKSRLFVEEILAAIRDLEIPHRRSPAAQMVTVSIGVATTQPDAEKSAMELIKAADAQLYAAKQTGKNRVVYRGKAEPGG